ncbi:MAG: ATP-binding protein, partial [Proteobacteria bacterium]|nr:ATP-binding protein [Pseudomonadota bacterium]
SQKMEMVGQLTGGIAHDFNNLLAVILGNLEFMDDYIEPGTTLGSLKDGALRATLRGADLTQRLLAFSRKQALRPEYTDTNNLIQELSELMRRTLGDHVEIDCRLAADLNRIVIDPGQLENSLLNLAINARDAMPDGGKITIVTENADFTTDHMICWEGLTPGSYVVITVTDTGSGMPADVRRHVFEPFFTTKEAGKGSGLGLSMVYGFVKQSDGHVTIDSNPGDGTAIRLYLPLPKHLPRHKPSAPATIRFQPSGTENVLVVENDPDVRDNLTAALKALGYQVASAGDGPAAMAMLDDLPPLDLLITDLMMPHGMNGKDVAGIVRERYPNVRILFTSGTTTTMVAASGGEDDTIAFLPKPYRRTVLAQTIRQLLDAA